MADEEASEHIGSSEEVQEARKQVSDLEDQNDEAIMRIVAIVRVKVAQEHRVLKEISEVSPHLMTRFLVKQASEALDLANNLLSVALELGVPEGGLQLPAPSIPDLPSNTDEGTGQYL